MDSRRTSTLMGNVRNQNPMTTTAVKYTDKIKNATSTNNKTKQMLIVGVVIVIIVILLFVVMSRKEMMEDVFYLDQIGMQNTDPTKYKYTGRDKDILGMSVKDYYLENEQYAMSNVAPQLFIDNSKFKNQTDYLDMPKIYRPTSLSSVKNLIE